MPRSASWSEDENRLIVADYLAMLADELKDRPFNKSARNEQLRALLRGRTHGSVERKHQNISAVLREMGLPWINGYKPLGNYQDSLAAAVVEQLDRKPPLGALIEKVSADLPTDARLEKWATMDRLVEPPEMQVREGSEHETPRERVARKFDYPERDARNRRLGALGEKFVFESERHRLKREGRDDLAARVEWTSSVRGDGLGYDVRSFATSGPEIFIEVKTTNMGQRFPFIVSRNEVGASEDIGSAYRLFRVFRFSQDPHVFVLPGPVSSSCRLEPRSYLARVG